MLNRPNAQQQERLRDLEATISNVYHTDELNRQPGTEQELYALYCNSTDPLYQYVRFIKGENLFVVSNELRAMFGHLAEYRCGAQDRSELKKAYGHFRRLNIDILKILCDELDKLLSKWLRKHYSYELQTVDSTFLEKYSKDYMQAKSMYLTAQQEERVGSDQNVHNIIDIYFEAAKAYMELYAYYRQNVKAVERKKFWLCFRMGASIIMAVAIIAASVLSFL